ncbi:phosphatidylglycerophosphatase A family protein [Oleiharenicola lentus]|uniref:phosphatidylglycerophosphatase A family protein n=1 Tax=Oleiharenicola lentus TaxID=2508720 RepID=UPI003F67490E
MRLSEPQWLRRLPKKWVVGVATLGPLGTRLPAPGTWGSLAGLLYTLLVFRSARWEVTVVWTVILSYIAVAFTGEAGRRLGKEDPGEIVLDEFIVIPLVFLGWRAGYLAGFAEWKVAIAGFALFRLFDILKPFGIAKLQRWPGGWGVVADDFVAALAACVTLHIGAWLLAIM